jgi:hypothetical protein
VKNPHAPAIVIPFTGASSSNGDGDPRLRQLEALYREMARIAPGHFQQVCSLALQRALRDIIVPLIFDGRDTAEHVSATMAATRAHLEYVREQLARGECVVVGNIWYDENADPLDVLLVETRRDVEDLRLGRQPKGGV